jgi:hypothetical protein
MADQPHQLPPHTRPRQLSSSQDPQPCGRRPSHPSHRPSHHPHPQNQVLLEAFFSLDKVTLLNSNLHDATTTTTRRPTEESWRSRLPDLGPGATPMADQLHQLAQHNSAKTTTTLSHVVDGRHTPPTDPLATQPLRTNSHSKPFCRNNVTSTQSCLSTTTTTTRRLTEDGLRGRPPDVGPGATHMAAKTPSTCLHTRPRRLSCVKTRSHVDDSRNTHPPTLSPPSPSKRKPTSTRFCRKNVTSTQSLTTPPPPPLGDQPRMVGRAHRPTWTLALPTWPTELHQRAHTLGQDDTPVSRPSAM